MSSFGALTDHFGYLSENFVGTNLSIGARAKLVASSEVKIEQSRANALDEHGDIAASTFYGNTTQNIRDVSVTYLCNTIGGLGNWFNTILLGYKIVGGVNFIIESFEFNSSNSEFPTITLSGKKNVATLGSPPTGKTNTFRAFFSDNASIPSGPIAWPIGFTVGAGLRLTSLSISSSINLTTANDGLGEPIVHGLSAGEGTLSAEFVRVTSDTPSWTIVNSSLVETQSPSIDQGQAAYHTCSAAAAYTVTRVASS